MSGAADARGGPEHQRNRRHVLAQRENDQYIQDAPRRCYDFLYNLVSWAHDKRNAQALPNRRVRRRVEFRGVVSDIDG
ncbi:hypothetical protein V4C55_39940 [Paraburkholderia sabiae]|uniref:Uncharacterized protein n=1 Tax=Paraburkholderia sabiae TaxID=273251 RepID=A0ABU9QR31_9BURK